MRFYRSRFAALPVLFVLSFAAVISIHLILTAPATAQTTPDARKAEADRLLDEGIQQYQTSHYQEAMQLWEQALQLYRAIGDRNSEGWALTKLGNAYLSLSQYDKAIEAYQQALSIFQATGDRDGQGLLLANIGKLLYVQNQPQLAIVFFKQSVNVRESIRGDNRGLPKQLQQSYIDSIAADYRQLADLLLQQNRVLEAQRVLDLLKVQELEDYLQNVSRSPQTQSGVEYWQPEQKIIELYKTAIDEGEELAQLDEKAKSVPLSAAEQQRHDELTQRQTTILTSFNQFIDRPEIQQAITQLTQTTQRQNIELDQLNSLQNNLRSLNQNAVLLYPLILEDRLELVLVTPDAPPIRRPVNVKAVDLNRAIVQMGQALKDPNSDVQPIAQKLYDWLIKPIEADLAAAHAKTIIYAPDGALRYIPLAALYDSHQKEGEQWLIQRFAISHITAASLTDFDQPPSYRPAGGNTGTPQLHVLAAACAQCNFNIQVNGQSYQFANLPYTEQEVNTLASEIPGTRTLLNRAFTPSIVSQMRQYPIVHLATHAAFVQGKPDDSFIVFGDGNSVPLSEIRNWNLPNTDLVVLSACETAVGEQQLGSGVEILGFGYQMQRAGARAAIASLWQVSDGGTQVLMNAFYTALEHGMTKAQALQQAQIALITHNLSGVGDSRGWVEVVSTRTGLPAQVSNHLSHPYYWAPFILIGNGL
ncbi:MAG TPA: CHAT domain-containing protein [Coleofasciculaceae cyanobacterium]